MQVWMNSCVSSWLSTVKHPRTVLQVEVRQRQAARHIKNCSFIPMKRVGYVSRSCAVVPAAEDRCGTRKTLNVFVLEPVKMHSWSSEWARMLLS